MIECLEFADKLYHELESTAQRNTIFDISMQRLFEFKTFRAQKSDNPKHTCYPHPRHQNELERDQFMGRNLPSRLNTRRVWRTHQISNIVKMSDSETTPRRQIPFVLATRASLERRACSSQLLWKIIEGNTPPSIQREIRRF